MFCTECGQKLEDHDFVSKDSVFNYHDLNVIRYTAPCDTCGKNLFDHPVRCPYCGRVFCRNHALPQKHDCQNIPPHPPSPPPRVYSLEEKFHAFLVALIQIIIVVAGIAIILWGAGIAMDNRSGHHVTFPFAGYITSTIGFLVIVAGLRLRLLVRLLQ